MNDKLFLTLTINDFISILDERIALANSKNLPKTDEEILLKRADVARLFGISLVTLNQWMKDGRIRYHRINSRVFFKRAEVMEALNSVKKYDRK
jgi:excisionase family DNA binding protein